MKLEDRILNEVPFHTIHAYQMQQMFINFYMKWYMQMYILIKGELQPFARLA